MRRLIQSLRFAPKDYPSQIDQPVLMLAAGADRVVSTAAIERFAARLPAGSHRLIEGARHEILQEQDRYRAQYGRPSMPSCPVRQFRVLRANKALAAG